MRISKMIEQLQMLQREHGDIRVTTEGTDWMGTGKSYFELGELGQSGITIEEGYKQFIEQDYWRNAGDIVTSDGDDLIIRPLVVIK